MPAHTFVRSNIAGSAPEWVGPPGSTGTTWTTWLAAHTYAVGAFVVPPTANGWYYECTASTGPTGATPPAFPEPTGDTVVDGGATWTCRYTTAVLAAELAQFDASIQGLVNGGPPPLTTWAAHHEFYALGSCVTPTNANGLYYQVTASTTGESGATEPIWPTNAGATIVDGGVTWTCQGSASFEADGGGSTHAPTSPIIIGGSGWGLVEGTPLVVARGGYLRVLNAGGVAFGAGDYWNYGPGHVARTRVLNYSCAEGLGWPNFAWRVRWGDGGMQAVAGLIDQSDGNGPQPVSLKVPLRSHNGATLSQVQVFFRIGYPHQNVPSVLPTFRVVRVDTSGNVTPLTSKAAGGDPNGYVSATAPSSVAGWTGKQSTVITCDQNNIVDLTQYSYYVEIIEEQTPGGYPWSLVATAPVKAVFNDQNPAVALGFSTTADGITVGRGDRVLVIVSGGAAAFGFLTGIYSWGATGVTFATRSPDMQSKSVFVQGMIVPVDLGHGLGGAYLQAQSTTATWDPGSMPAGAFAWAASINYNNDYTILPTVPNGYWYSNNATTGTGGGSEPDWPTVIGATVADGAATLTCMGETGDTLSFVGRPELDDELPGYAGTGFFCHGNIYDCVQATYTNILSGAFQ